MRIGLITFHSFAQPGGVKSHVLGLYKEYKKRGIYTKIIVPRRDPSENYGKDVLLLGTSFQLNIGGSQADLDVNFNPLAISSLFKKEKFDVLHFHNFSFPSGFQVLERSKALNILTFHANLEGTKLFKIFPFLLTVFENAVNQRISGIIGVNPLNLKVFRDFKGPKIVIPNGIDLKVFNPKVPKIKKYLDGKINILFLGRIEERKGLMYLLKAYKILQKKHDNLRLIVAGEGPLKGECEDYIGEKKLKNIVFEGMVSPSKTASFYRTADIYCSPAIYGESFGIVLVEAMACGTPVVAFGNSGYKIVLDKPKGRKFLARPRDYKTLAKKLELLIKSNELRKEMGEWGIKESQQYSWPKIADRVLAFYELCKKEKQKS